MQQPTKLHAIIGNMDIYLLDQVMKERYHPGESILDAGCGEGRNMHWFIYQGYEVYATDIEEHCINTLKETYPTVPADQFKCAPVEAMPFADNCFKHIISSAVLHFARDEQHFFAMLFEMLRLLAPGGSLFIRMASNIGIEDKVMDAGAGRYFLPDGTVRFLLNRHLLQQVFHRYPVIAAEPFKTVNVADERCMSTMVLLKQ